MARFVYIVAKSFGEIGGNFREAKCFLSEECYLPCLCGAYFEPDFKKDDSSKMLTDYKALHLVCPMF